MGKIKIGSVFVTANLDTSGIKTDLERAVKVAEKGLSAKIKLTIDKPAFQQHVKETITKSIAEVPALVQVTLSKTSLGVAAGEIAALSSRVTLPVNLDVHKGGLDAAHATIKKMAQETEITKGHLTARVAELNVSTMAHEMKNALSMYENAQAKLKLTVNSSTEAFNKQMEHVKMLQGRYESLHAAVEKAQQAIRDSPAGQRDIKEMAAMDAAYEVAYDAIVKETAATGRSAIEHEKLIDALNAQQDALVESRASFHDETKEVDKNTESHKKNTEAKKKKGSKATDINIGSGSFKIHKELIAPAAGIVAAGGVGAFAPLAAGAAIAAPVLAGMVPLLGAIAGLLKNNASLATQAGEGWKTFQTDVQAASLGALESGVGAVNALLHDIVPLTNAVGIGFAHAGDAWRAAFEGAEFSGIFASFKDIVSGGVIESINSSFINLAAGVGHLLVAFAPLTTFFISGLATMAANFDAWSTQVGASAGFKQFIEYAKTNGALVLNILQNLGGAIANLLPVLAGMGTTILQAFSGVATALKWVTDLPFGPFILGALASAIALGKLFAIVKEMAILTRLAAGFKAVVTAVQASIAIFKLWQAGMIATRVAATELALTLGPIGLAAIALGTAFMFLSRSHKAVADTSSSFAAAFDAETGALLASANATIKKAEADNDLIDKAGKLGISSDEIVAGIRNENGERDKLLAKLNAMNTLPSDRPQTQAEIDTGNAIDGVIKLLGTEGQGWDDTARRAKQGASGTIGVNAAVGQSIVKNTAWLKNFQAESSKHVQQMQDAIAATARTAALADANKAVVSADKAAARQIIDGRKQIRDAIKGVSDARKNEATVAKQSAENIKQAEEGLRSAHKETIRAQQDVNTARKEAAVTLRDLTAAANDAKRSQEDANVSLLRAWEQYDVVFSNASSTDLDRREVLAKVSDAQGELTNATTANRDATAAKDKAVQDGVDKAAGVLAAQEALTKARQDETKAQQDLAKAHTDAGIAAVNAAAATATALESLRTTEQTVSDARIAAVDAVAAAHQRVTDTITANKLALAQLKDRDVQLMITPTVAGSFSVDKDGNIVFTATPKAKAKSVAAEPARSTPGNTVWEHTGGRIPGYGGGDIQPAMLEPGEAVVPKHLVAEMAPWAAAKKIPGFALGGLVPSTQGWIKQQDPKPYVYGAGGPAAWDCSSLVSAVWGLLTGHGAVRHFTTRSNFPSFGFKPGTGAFTMGVNPGQHMAGNLLGLPFEAQQPSTGIKVGAGAQSVMKFAQQWYLPQLAGAFAAGGVGAASSAADVVGRMAVTMGDVQMRGPALKRALNTIIAQQTNQVAGAALGKTGKPLGPYSVGATVTPTFRKLLESLGAGPAAPADAAVDTGIATSHAANQALGKKLNAARGWAQYWPDFNKLVMGESGWDNTAQNPTSTAYGIMQFLNSTWAGVGGTKTSDAGKQIGYGLDYIKNRYVNPKLAEQFKLAHNWYDGGGLLQPGLTLARNSTGQPERVLSPAQTQQYDGGEGVSVEKLREALEGMRLDVGGDGIARLVTKKQQYDASFGGRR